MKSTKLKIVALLSDIEQKQQSRPLDWTTASARTMHVFSDGHWMDRSCLITEQRIINKWMDT